MHRRALHLSQNCPTELVDRIDIDLTIPDFGSGLTVDSDTTNEYDCTAGPAPEGYVCTKHALNKEEEGHVDGNDSGILAPEGVTLEDLDWSITYCVQIAGGAECPLSSGDGGENGGDGGNDGGDGDNGDIVNPIGGDDNGNGSNSGGGSGSCDPTDPFCDIWAPPEGCDEQTVIDAIVPDDYYNPDMDAKYNWRCIKFTDDFISAGDHNPMLLRTTYTWDPILEKITTIEVIAENGNDETVTHKLQPKEVDSETSETFKWFTDPEEMVDWSIGGKYDNADFWANNVMQMNRTWQMSGDMFKLMGSGKYLEDSAPDHYTPYTQEQFSRGICGYLFAYDKPLPGQDPDTLEFAGFAPIVCPPRDA